MKAHLPHRFIMELRKYDLLSILAWTSQMSVNIFNQKSPEMPAVTMKNIFYNGKDRTILIMAWSLIDVAYLALMNCNLNGGKHITTLEEFTMLIGQYNGYHNDCEGNMSIIKDSTPNNDFMLYLYGFFGEQCNFENATETRQLLDSYKRNRYLLELLETAPDTEKVDVSGIIQKEIGVSSEDYHSIMLALITMCKDDPRVFVNKLKPDGIQDGIRKVLDYYSLSVKEFKKSDNRRQQLYVTPFLRIGCDTYICLNYYLG